MPFVHVFVNPDGSIFQVKPTTEPVGKMDTYVVFGFNFNDRELTYFCKHLYDFTINFNENWPIHNITHKRLSNNLCTPLANEFQHLNDKYIIELLYDYNPLSDKTSCSFFTDKLINNLDIGQERKYWEDFYIHYHNEPMIDYVRWAVAHGTHGDIILSWATLDENLRQQLTNSHLIKDSLHKEIIKKYYDAGKRLEERIKQNGIRVNN